MTDTPLDLDAIQARADAAPAWPTTTVTNRAGMQKLDTSQWTADEWNAMQPAIIDFMAHGPTDARALVAEVRTLRANPRDEYHTMDELYDYRMLYNALAFNAWAAAGTYPVVKSWRHSDGELCFGGGWFIVVATLPTGQVANHYKAEHWDLFNLPDVWFPPTYDGHTPAIAAERMRALLNSEARP